MNGRPMMSERNPLSVFSPLCASNHSDKERIEHDFYATDPLAMQLLLEHETFDHNIWECACGQGHLSKVLEQHGYNVHSTDLYYRGYGERESVDFLAQNALWDGDIVTNPPYQHALDFVKHSLELIKTGHKTAFFLRLQFLEGKKRREFFNENPPKTVYVFSSRINCARNGNFEEHCASAAAYAWFIWLKGFTGDPILKWIN